MGRSVRTIVWEVVDSRNGQTVLLTMPRTQPAGADGLQRWLDSARAVARVRHPRLLPVLEVDELQQRPYMVCQCPKGRSLVEQLHARAPQVDEIVRWLAQLLEALVVAHDAGVAHGDLQLHMLQLDEHGELQLQGLAVAPEPIWPDTAGPQQIRRALAERDLLAFSLLMHHLLAGRPALDEPDTGRVMERVPPLGQEMVRLPQEVPQPISDALRVIVNRSLGSRPRQRYQQERSLALALQGLAASKTSRSDVSTHLLERVRRQGVLPLSPGGTQLAARMQYMESMRVDELALQVLQDPALSFELLRQANTARVRGAQVSGFGAVGTVRRSLSMTGLRGLQQAAQMLRTWPGPLPEETAAELRLQLQRAQHAARLAQALRPPGYDEEIVYLVTLLQHLGTLLLHYHFPELAAQMRFLTESLPAAAADEMDTPGMDERAAAQLVLGMDLCSLAAVVARQWGLDGSVLQMMRRMPLDQSVRANTDDEVMRVVASAACEAMYGYTLPQRLSSMALERVVQRYGPLLRLDVTQLYRALQETAPQDDGVGVPA